MIADEIHRWKKRDFFNALMYGDIQRQQPLFLMITTSGDDLETIGFEEYELAKELLDPTSDISTISHFAIICEAGNKRDDDGIEILDHTGKPIPRDWDDTEGWLEANPTLREDDTERRLEKLQAKCDEAKASPNKKREFTRFICNRWVSDFATSYINWSDWKQRSVEIEIDKLAGRQCGAGLDLSS